MTCAQKRCDRPRPALETGHAVIPDSLRPANRRCDGIDSDRREVSRRSCEEAALAIGRKSQARPDIVSREIGEIAQDLTFSHPGREIIKHVIDGDPQSTDTGLAAALVGLDRDD
jgi:hypothetical protein